MRDVGEYVDLHYINKKPQPKVEVKLRATRKSFEQVVGTSYIFEAIGNEIKAWRRVPVLFG